MALKAEQFFYPNKYQVKEGKSSKSALDSMKSEDSDPWTALEGQAEELVIEAAVEQIPV